MYTWHFCHFTVVISNLFMSKTSVKKVLQFKWLLFTSKLLCNRFKLIILEVAKTDMRNILYTLKIFIDMTGNICKSNVIKV